MALTSMPRLLFRLFAAGFDLRRDHWEACFFPRIPAADEGGGVLDSVSIEVEHRTGACMLVLSSTVGDQKLFRGEISQPGQKLAERNIDRSRDMALVVRLFRADVDIDRFLRFDELHRLIAWDATRAGQLVLHRIRLGHLD